MIDTFRGSGSGSTRGVLIVPDRSNPGDESKKGGGMRLGLLFGGIDLTISEMVRVAREAEAIGMHGLYCVEA